MFETLYDTLNHLPVINIAKSITDTYLEGKVCIVTSPVASGKTLIIPAAIAAQIPEEENEVVWVLEPTRLLANNAAKNLRKLLGRLCRALREWLRNWLDSTQPTSSPVIAAA